MFICERVCLYYVSKKRNLDVKSHFSFVRSDFLGVRTISDVF